MPSIYVVCIVAIWFGLETHSVPLEEQLEGVMNEKLREPSQSSVLVVGVGASGTTLAGTLMSAIRRIPTGHTLQRGPHSPVP